MSETSHVDLPSLVDLLHPTLVEMNRFGAPTSITEVDDAVIGVLQLSEEQLAATYRSEHTPGTIVGHRLMMARSVLHKLGLAEADSSRGLEDHGSGERVSRPRRLRGGTSPSRTRNAGR